MRPIATKPFSTIMLITESIVTAENIGLVAMLVGGLGISAAAAQGTIDEVVVTAQKRAQDLSDIPIAISTFDVGALAEKGITNLAGIAASVPSITSAPYPSSNNTLMFFIRGQGTTNPMEITQDGAVGLYVDGFYIARPQSSTFDIADVERIEILRGPQGTLYGRNTSGGAVNIISKKPTGEFGFKQNFNMGSYNEFRSLTTLNLPEVAGVSAKLSHLRSSKDGYVKNAGPSHDFNESEQNATRLALAWRPDAAFSADYALDIGELNSTSVYYQNPSLNGMQLAADGSIYYAKNSRMKRSYRPIDLPLSTSDYQGHYLTLGWELSDNLTIKSLTGYRELSAVMHQDYAEIFFAPYVSVDYVDARQFSQEVQFIGAVPDAGLEYVAGVYYFRESGTHRVLNAGVLDRIVDAEAESAAVYGQLTWTPDILDSRLHITAGGRYTRDKRQAQRDFLLFGAQLPQAVTENDDAYQRFNPLLIAAFDVSDTINTYIKASTGYRAGGSSEASELDGFGNTFRPEDITSYEVGLKSYWWERRVRFNTALFYNDLDDMQITFNPGSGDPSFATAYNAGNAVIKGVEVDLLIMPTENLSLAVDYVYLDAEIKQVDVIPNTLFSEVGSPYRNDSNIARLFNVPLAPRHGVNVSADYMLMRFTNGTLKASLEYNWKDSVYISTASGAAIPNNDFWRIDAHGLLNARLTLALDLPRGDRATVSLWGRNIADQDYQYFVTPTGTPLTGYTTQGTAWNEPSTYGIDISYEY